jgi:FtsP/CotA-like multicopper oxidase with cupredoxin domain
MVLAACGTVSQAPVGRTILVGQAQAGQTVQAHVGDTVRVRLTDQFPVPGSSVVWDVSSSSPSVLVLNATVSPSPRPMHGEATYSADFAAQAAGQAQLLAHAATSCEAMPKLNCPDQRFTITVVIS